MPVKVLTALCKGSPISHFIKDNLKSRRMDFEGRELWSRAARGVIAIQINMADSGWGFNVGPRVIMTRAGEVAENLAPDDFDFERIFAKGKGRQRLPIFRFGCRCVAEDE